ncbi:hypothetical protein DFA_04540 [Cavenderia fasciculata]|uniref:Uncharacterized protein n=1 Tax=Cavenderia fasciculata TaxID=261658 RepID=F4PPV6_CACFS|nr:uncharacterized protein DFA_04540 [Cavenderia fasciculata]EGG22419.1 hypothetical protein DFA_04540 [Cavenderia fasciculata]|eukprot:XP_004360270.1 hypothetical protein DFA_04540 [Cavenderia fasciculata]
MGQSASRCSEDEYLNPTSFPNVPFAQHRVGDVYLVTYTSSPSSLDPTTNLDYHYTIVIDVAGESSSFPRGLELYLGVQGESRVVRLCQERLKHPRINYRSHQAIGKIQNIYHQGKPRQWSDGIRDIVGNEWFPEFVNKRGNILNHQCNSHQFAKYLIKYFDLDWPNYIYVAGDWDQNEPLMVDL